MSDINIVGEMGIIIRKDEVCVKCNKSFKKGEIIVTTESYIVGDDIADTNEITCNSLPDDDSSDDYTFHLTHHICPK